VTEQTKQVIVIFGDKVLRVSKKQWDAVMSMAGQMEDDQVEYVTSIGRSPNEGYAALRALEKLKGVTQ
jgi:chemotaxis signal transduction protein